MPPAPQAKPDKRQRSIAAMFGVKDPAPTTATIKGSASTPSSTGKTPSSKLTTSAPSKNKPKTSAPRISVSAGHLARVSYHMLQPIEPEIFYNTLSAEFKELLALELDAEHGLAPSYLRALRAQLTKQYFLDLKRFLIKEGINQPGNTIYPSSKNIYHWSRATPLDQIRVVIIGQDPYHGPGQAHGLSFSVPKGIPIPGSLRNIYQELKKEYPEFKIPTHGTLRSWAQSGVLLLNTSLTVQKGQAGSHSNKGWEQFTDAVVDAIDLYGGLGLLNNNKHSSTLETNHSIEPSSKRVKLDSGSEVDAHQIKDTNPLIPSSDPNSTSSLAALHNRNAESLNNNSEEEKNIKTSPSLPSDQTLTESDPKNKSGEDSTVHDTKPPKRAGFGQGVVFLCWGKWAADRVARLSESKHLILKSAHPSPLSAHRGFLGNNHFKLANEWLENKYGEAAKIDWCHLVP